MHNWFAELSAVDVSAHVKQKNGMNYLSWMWAWAELKKRYPLSYSTVHETEDGMLVWKDPKGCHVKTSVTIVWEEDGNVHEHRATEYLPCMDYKNKYVEYEDVDAMLVNKTIQRSLTKCIARLGLGGYLFANEDLPEEVIRYQELMESCKNLVKRKCEQSDNAKKKVAEICNELAADYSGDYRLIKDTDVLEELYNRLLAIRK